MESFRLVIRAALCLRACPSLSSMHTLLAFVKGKNGWVEGNLQARVFRRPGQPR